MKILIVYDTYSSGTLVVSELLQEELTNAGNTAEIINVANADLNTFKNYDLVLLGSPSWMNNNKDGQPHHTYYAFMEEMKKMNWENTKFAVFGLGDNAYARLCGAVDVLETFVKEIKGKLIVDSLRIDSFYFEQKNNEEKARKWAHSIV